MSSLISGTEEEITTISPVKCTTEDVIMIPDILECRTVGLILVNTGMKIITIQIIIAFMIDGRHKNGITDRHCLAGEKGPEMAHPCQVTGGLHLLYRHLAGRLRNQSLLVLNS